MQYIIDIVIALILVLSIINGYKRGFIKTVFSCFAVVVALGAAYFLGPVAGDYIRSTDIYANVEEKVDVKIEQYFENSTENAIRNPMQDSELSGAAESLERLGINVEELYENYSMSLAEGSQNFKEGFVKSISDPILSALSTALGAIAVFIIALIVLKILSLILGGIFSLPLLKGLNKFAGGLAGVVLGVLSVFALCLVVEVILPYIPNNPVLYMGMDKDTFLYGFFVRISPMFFLLFG